MERTIRLNFDVSFVYGARTWRVPLVAAMLLSAVGELNSESVTLSTYYPAPSGVYTNMITTSNTYLARDGGNVGVGTTSPGSKLDVRGHITAQDPGDADFVQLWYDGAIISGRGGSTTALRFGFANNQAAAGWAEMMRIEENGYVGIGTASPASKLSVVGNVTVASGGGASGYIKIIASACGVPVFVGTSATDPEAICSAGTYATFAPGFYTEGWSSQSQGGPVKAARQDGSTTSQVLGLRPGAQLVGLPKDVDWTTLRKDDSGTYVYCCPR